MSVPLVKFVIWAVGNHEWLPEGIPYPLRFGFGLERQDGAVVVAYRITVFTTTDDE